MKIERDFLRLKQEDVMDYENGFYWYSSPNRLAKLCAQYELYKSIIDLPGDVIETGVFKASTLIRLATFRHFFEVPASRSIFAFDAFGKFPKLSDKGGELIEDINYANTYDDNFGIGLSPDEIIDILKKKNIDSNIHYIKGDITSTMPSFFEDNPYLCLSFVHVDVEVYEPTMTILEHCWPRLVPNGVIALDDLNHSTGAAKAINDFFCNKHVNFSKLPFSDAPAYIKKNN